jgi:hypothetical protein
VDDRIRFTVSLDDMIATQRLATRTYAFAGAALFIILGLGLTALGHGGGLIVAALGLLVLIAWRFPVIDRWLIRRRAAARIGSDCEVWLDDGGVAYRQAGLEGHIDWKAVTRIVEDGHSVILMQGGIGLIAIPLRAFGSPEAAATFLATVRASGHIPGP